MKKNRPQRPLALVWLLCVSLFSSCTAESPVSVYVATRTSACTGQIFIGGAVHNPGIYPFGASDTLSDLLRAAGGLMEGYDLSQVNLSVMASTEASSPQKININTAAEWLLEALPGIGPASAANIVSFRAQYGNFRSITDLLQVPGIGPATLAKIAALITVNQEDEPVWP